MAQYVNLYPYPNYTPNNISKLGCAIFTVNPVSKNKLQNIIKFLETKTQNKPVHYTIGEQYYHDLYIENINGQINYYKKKETIQLSSLGMIVIGHKYQIEPNSIPNLKTYDREINKNEIHYIFDTFAIVLCSSVVPVLAPVLAPVLEHTPTDTTHYYFKINNNEQINDTIKQFINQISLL